MRRRGWRMTSTGAYELVLGSVTGVSACEPPKKVLYCDVVFREYPAEESHRSRIFSVFAAQYSTELNFLSSPKAASATSKASNQAAGRAANRTLHVSWLDDSPNGEAGLNSSHAGQAGQNVRMDALVAGRVRNGHAKEVIRGSGHEIALPNVRTLAGRFLEASEVLVRLSLE